MEPLNMCMFATRVDYDAAVRKRHEMLRNSSVDTQCGSTKLKRLDKNQDSKYNTHFPIRRINE